MARKKRVWERGKYYHIVSRGNRREPLFLDKGDFLTYLYILQKVYEKVPFELASYCLMSNHFHLQMKTEEQSISKVMSLINKRYANYYNNKYGLTGHVFEKRFFDQVIETKEGIVEVSSYIHLNPVEAKMVKQPEDYPWSSYYYIKRRKMHPFNYVNFEPLFDYFPGLNVEKYDAYIEFIKKKVEHLSTT